MDEDNVKHVAEPVERNAADLDRLRAALARTDGAGPRHTRRFFAEHPGWRARARG